MQRQGWISAHFAAIHLVTQQQGARSEDVLVSCHLSSSLPLPGQSLARQGAPGAHKAATGR